MCPKVRRAVIGVSVVVILGSLGAFLATGMYPYTRFRDHEIEQANAESDLSDLFAETSEGGAEAPRVESVNAIGFLPSGPGLASISVVTLSGPAVLAIGVVTWLGRKKKKQGSCGCGEAKAEGGQCCTNEGGCSA